MLLVSISNPPQEVIGYDGVTYEGPVFDVPQNVGEMLMARADLWRLPTQEEIDSGDVDHSYDGREENRGRPEQLHDGRTRRRGAEATHPIPEPDREVERSAEPVPGEPGSLEPVPLPEPVEDPEELEEAADAAKKAAPANSADPKAPAKRPAAKKAAPAKQP